MDHVGVRAVPHSGVGYLFRGNDQRNNNIEAGWTVNRADKKTGVGCGPCRCQGRTTRWRWGPVKGGNDTEERHMSQVNLQQQRTKPLFPTHLCVRLPVQSPAALSERHWMTYT